MRFLLSFVVEEGGMENATPEEMQEAMVRWTAFDEEAADRGALIACEPLEGSAETTTVHISDSGERVVTDGPFAESKEFVGGFCLLDCANLDEALEWANKVPLGAGAIEIRPAMDLSRFGYVSRTLTRAAA
jgi:hypothetical protein